MTPAILPAVTHYDDDANVIEYIPAEPCPELLTASEAARFLRLDLIDIKNPEDTLKYYCNQGLLHETRMGKAVRYSIHELRKFIERQTTINSGKEA